MKELMKYTNKSEWLTIGIYKTCIYICWFLFACCFNFFLKDTIKDSKLILLVISLLLLYGVRVFLKFLYKKNSSSVFYNIKHAIEMYYFKKLERMSIKNLEDVNKEELSDKILTFSYNFTKSIADVFEIVLPTLIGLFILFIKLLDLNKIFGIVIFFGIIALLIITYNSVTLEEEKIPNYNDNLKEFILKIKPIKKLNIFPYCVKKLDSIQENDLCIINNNDILNDLKFTKSIFAIISLILLMTFFFINNTVTRLGVIIFFIIMFLKMQELLYKINPTIKNMIRTSIKKIELDNYFQEEEPVKINKSWKKISIIEGLVNYNQTTEDVKIPTFELLRKDHISVMGASGQGKSTILNILSGIFTLDKGDILFDGNKGRQIVDAYYSDEEPIILKVSLKENLTALKQEKDEVLIGLIKEIGLMDWYSSLPNGLEEILSDDLDLAIIEKLNIIRAIISDKDIYFFDEPVNHLDNDSISKVASILKKYFKDKTYIIISKKTALTNICTKHYFIKNHTLLEKEPLL